MSRTIRSCYIAAPAGVNLSVLRRALSERQIDVVVPDGLTEGTDLPSEILDLVSQVDLVIGVLTTERRSSWVLFELGLAWASRRQIMLISAPQNDFVPSNLQRFLVLRANPSNAEAVGFALDQLLAAPPPRAISSGPAKRSFSNQPDPTTWTIAQQALAAIQKGEGRRLEQLLAETLRRSGVEVVSEFAVREDSRADMAIWSDVLESVVGNPLLVEVKLQLRSLQEAKDAAYALSDQIAASGTRWGLLLYGKGFDPSGRIHGWLPPNILAMDVASLFDQMQAQSFAEVVTNLRNQRVHGRHP